ncbi:glycosyltransferase family 1 protein [Fibrobacter sp. UWB2]|uniref:glycosyltransferase family 4 protein n=1 Tax=Fibrobacter sp. UWB2 TaxID=1964358 RepID=UPI000B524388|nr:glycosyltransferase family 4 protein [Fibrobacter sp. UWB2]OWV24470.1 glycosyltransferase family 1 protein [Fibrobacter sp. UWB2]
MKVLYVTTISATMGFFPEHVKMLLSEGHSVEIATNCEKPVPEIYNTLGCKVHDIPFSRSPFSKNNLIAYKMLKQLVESEHYDIVHTHTPNASMIVRLACRRVRKQGTRVIYTAHGFHFFRGAPLKNWFIYYPIEKFCAHFTDVLITINKEDFTLAQNKMPAKKICYVPGVGIDLSKIQNIQCDRNVVRLSMGVPEDCILLLSVGELSVRKNHQVVMRALAKLDNPKIHYAVAGSGKLENDLRYLAKSLRIESNFHLLGFRTDVIALNKSADISVLPSLHEGLPVALMEAMAVGLPIVCSKIRGNVDLIEHGKGGFLYGCQDVDGFARGIMDVVLKSSSEMRKINQNTIKNFDVKKICGMMKQIYKDCCNGAT